MDYYVIFETRKKRVPTNSFVVSAESPTQAQSMAVRLLRQCGENPLHFKPPKTRIAATTAK